jgi:hypothetical protein
MDLVDVGWEAIDVIHLAGYRDSGQVLVNMVMNIQVP